MAQTVKMVTFQTVMVPARATAEAYCMFGGQYVPKSQATFVVEFEEQRPGGFDRKGKKLPPIVVQVGQITMPEWLARK